MLTLTDNRENRKYIFSNSLFFVSKMIKKASPRKGTMLYCPLKNVPKRTDVFSCFPKQENPFTPVVLDVFTFFASPHLRKKSRKEDTLSSPLLGAT